LLPQEFILDDQTGVNDPLGMMAARLEVRVHMVTVASSALQNVVTAVNRAGVHVDDTGIRAPGLRGRRSCEPTKRNWVYAWQISVQDPPASSFRRKARWPTRAYSPL